MHENALTDSFPIPPIDRQEQLLYVNEQERLKPGEITGRHQGGSRGKKSLQQAGKTIRTHLSKERRKTG
jgi:hypothetical protein